MGGGTGSGADASVSTDFYWSTEDEPHASRRKAILKKYPEVQKLMGPEPRTKWIVFTLVTLQISLSIVLQEASWPVYVGAAYIVGATATHALFLAIHELAHNLGAKRPEANRLIAIVANLPIVFPYCITFKQYHIDHHKHQGVDGVDTDIPARLEAAIFRGPLGKLVWCMHQILFYALRPMMIKSQTPTAMHALNIVVQVTFDLAIFKLFGAGPLLYMVLCLFLAGSLHPTAGHFLSEHYVFDKGQETYSYYGWLNLVTFNVGYHNEHHDFPYIAWSKLPQLRRMAPEFYSDISSYTSWSRVIWDFVTRGDMSMWSRTKRAPRKHSE
eukprot:CAMPEP_0119406082 /NCGR_PEP_ID=MMETSP1335-20130426/548_1 /TAXON_ID=259385 /ORGANISM="Chrysoculter rhomboideus, Strain RCC1486" /LENGTH=326 /DNA_ID=CAMNT_0007430141 /DNA_START=22 /DNA_END=1002 /DNA_ORIENTATION=-